MPHHLRANEDAVGNFREGVVLDRPSKEGHSLVSVGTKQEVLVNKALQPGLRVTVKLGHSLGDDLDFDSNRLIRGSVVSPSAPRVDAGLYWGYTVRLVDTLSHVFKGNALAKGGKGYDLVIGTSERGASVDDFRPPKAFKHCLIVFGGVKGLEAALEADDAYLTDDPAPLFQHYLNTCPVQGSRTIRTEEAVLVTLAALRPKITPR